MVIGTAPLDASSAAAARGGIETHRVLVPFILISLIWGSSWIVIKDQLGSVPPAWSAFYRHALGSAAMLLVAAVRSAPINLDRRGHMLAAGFGLFQFFLNFNFVYAAEQHITSGVVAVVFALLVVPNSAFAWLFLKQEISRDFLIGSAMAAAGVGFLFSHEMQAAAAPVRDGAIGIGLTMLALLSSSISNVMQASRALRRYPIATLASWAMVYGMIGGFNGWSQRFILEEMECGDEASTADLLHGSAAGRDLGSMAARGIDEFDRPTV